MKGLLILVLLSPSLWVFAQDSIPPPANKYIFFPYPITKGTTRYSLGITNTAMPQDITEEVQVRSPAGDFHILHGLSGGFYLDGRASIQFIQNHGSLGIRWARAIDRKFSFSLGDDFAFWHGSLTIASFDTKAHGWLNYPNASVGYRLDSDLLLTLKGEALINLSSQSMVGGITVTDRAVKFSGWSASLMLEQPFYHKRSLTLGVRAMYTNFFWQTWSLFETYDRNIFFPEIVTGFIF